MSLMNRVFIAFSLLLGASLSWADSDPELIFCNKKLALFQGEPFDLKQEKDGERLQKMLVRFGLVDNESGGLDDINSAMRWVKYANFSELRNARFSMFESDARTKAFYRLQVKPEQPDARVKLDIAFMPQESVYYERLSALSEEQLSLVNYKGDKLMFHLKKRKEAVSIRLRDERGTGSQWFEAMRSKGKGLRLITPDEKLAIVFDDIDDRLSAVSLCQRHTEKLLKELENQ